MYLPGYYDDPITEYWHLLNNVTVWDVAVERIIEISGPDAQKLTNLLTCRDLTKCAVGQEVRADHRRGRGTNDPVLLRVDEDRFGWPWPTATPASTPGVWPCSPASTSR